MKIRYEVETFGETLEGERWLPEGTRLGTALLFIRKGSISQRRMFTDTVSLVNGKLADKDDELHDGDIVSIISILGGG